MQNFYFNECFPLDAGIYNFTTQFALTLKEFNVLLKKEIGVDPAIITEKLPSHMDLGAETNLQKVIEGISNLELRNLAFSLFIKYPIHGHFVLYEEVTTELLEKNYWLSVGKESYDALNLAITCHSNGVLFTSATHEDLKANQLSCISTRDGSVLNVDSLFGDDNNTKYIEERIKSQEIASKSLWDQLLATFGECRYTSSFKRDFEGLRDVEKASVITAFNEAIARNLSSRFYPDTKHIADVTPQNAKQVVYELRIYTPTAIRVYFMEKADIVYAAKIGVKANPNQSLHIKQSDLLINKLVLTGM
ncbi:MAG TPA: hypothetical protein VGB63_07035 [Pedobacter sp.]|jgi:putative component of toxin-antitoxin plasmid stabilization module